MSSDFVDKIERYAIFRLDSEGYVRTWNAGAEQIKGYSRDEIRGTHYETFFPDEAVENRTPQRLLDRAETQGSVTGRGWRIHKDGSRFWADFTLTALFDASGELSGFAKVLQDTTAQRHYEQQLERQNEQLAEFASQASHDLKNPLGVAQGRLKLAGEECDSRHIDVAADAVERGLTLVDDLLTRARDRDRAGEVDEINLAQIATRCWQTVDTATETLVVDTDQTVTADPIRLEQILSNLFANAVKYGPDGVTVTVGELDDGFYVADSGPGIPESRRERVFDKEYSSDGTGLGLHIVQENIAGQGWKISVTDSETGGARFEITGVRFADE